MRCRVVRSLVHPKLHVHDVMSQKTRRFLVTACRMYTVTLFRYLQFWKCTFPLSEEQLHNIRLCSLYHGMNLAVTTWQAPIFLNDILSLCADICLWSQQWEYLAENSPRSVNFCYHRSIGSIEIRLYSHHQWRTQEFCSRGGGSTNSVWGQRTERTGIWGR